MCSLIAWSLFWTSTKHSVNVGTKKLCWRMLTKGAEKEAKKSGAEARVGLFLTSVLNWRSFRSSSSVPEEFERETAPSRLGTEKRWFPRTKDQPWHRTAATWWPRVPCTLESRTRLPPWPHLEETEQTRSRLKTKNNQLKHDRPRKKIPQSWTVNNSTNWWLVHAQKNGLYESR